MNVIIKDHNLLQSQRRMKVETRGYCPVLFRATEAQMIEFKDWLCCIPPSLMVSAPVWLQDVQEELNVRLSEYKILDLSV